MTQVAHAPSTAAPAVHPAPFRARRPVPSPVPDQAFDRIAAIAAELGAIAGAAFDLSASQIRNRIRMLIAALDQVVGESGATAAIDTRTELAFVDLQLTALGLDLIGDRLRLAAGLLGDR